MFVFIQAKDLQELNTEKLFNPRENNLILCLMDELVNTCKVFNLPVHYSVTSLLTSAPEFMFLYNLSDEPYEVPSVVYTGNYYDYTIFNTVFGENKTISKTSTFGDYYYFYDFETAKEKIFTNN